MTVKKQVFTWHARPSRLHLLVSEAGEVVDRVLGEYTNDTFTVESTKKRYLTLAAAQKAAEAEYLLALQKQRA